MLICDTIRSVAWAVSVASVLTSDATTAKPRPASPARAASMVAFKASRFVCAAMPVMIPTISPMASTFSASPPISALLRAVAWTSRLRHGHLLADPYRHVVARLAQPVRHVRNIRYVHRRLFRGRSNACRLLARFLGDRGQRRRRGRQSGRGIAHDLNGPADLLLQLVRHLVEHGALVRFGLCLGGGLARLQGSLFHGRNPKHFDRLGHTANLIAKVAERNHHLPITGGKPVHDRCHPAQSPDDRPGHQGQQPRR